MATPHDTDDRLHDDEHRDQQPLDDASPGASPVGPHNGSPGGSRDEPRDGAPGGEPGDVPADEIPPGEAGTVEILRRGLEQIRSELDHLRATARTAAVVEQAKGALAERLRCGVDAAYAHLLQIARDSGTPLATAAELLMMPGRPHDGGDDKTDDGSGDIVDNRFDDMPDDTADDRAGEAPAACEPPPRCATRDAASTLFADLAAQLHQVQRLANLGWSVRHPATGAIHWSDHLYEIFGRDPKYGPLPLHRLAEHVVAEDAPLTEHLVRTLLEGDEPIDAEIHLLRGEETRDLRLIGRPLAGTHGRPAAVHCVYQDITAWRRGERALNASRTQLERRRIEQERRQALEVQRSILPLPEGIISKPGLLAAVRYLPAEESARVGGDWYETTAIDGEGVFLAIGDVSGHGLVAAAAMARLRNGLSGLAFSGAPPDKLLYWLNLQALHWPSSLTATVLAGRYDPERRTLTWAQGGHFPPILIRGGAAATLDPPEGVLLGAIKDPVFGVATTELRAGDVLLLYTDGLIERRDRDLQEGIDRLVEVASAVGSTDPEKVLGHVLTAFGAPNPLDDTCAVAIQIQ